MRVRPELGWAEELDTQLKIPDLIQAFEPTELGWGRRVRCAFGLSSRDLARDMKLSQPAVVQLEQSEVARTISIATLAKIAEALECRLVYGFVRIMIEAQVG